MNVNTSKFTQTSGSLNRASSPAQEKASAPEMSGDSFTFSDGESGGAIKTVAKLAGLGAGVYAASLITGLDPGVGGVANGVVGAVGLGAMAMYGSSGLVDNARGEDKIIGAVGTLALGAAGFVAGGIMGGQGYNYAMLTAGALGLVGAGVLGAAADKLTG